MYEYLEEKKKTSINNNHLSNETESQKVQFNDKRSEGVAQTKMQTLANKKSQSNEPLQKVRKKGQTKKTTGKFRMDHRENDATDSMAIADRRGKGISSTLTQHVINYLTKEKNRTKIEGGQGNLWVSNKPVFVTENKSQGKSRSSNKMGARERNKRNNKVEKFVVIGMQGDKVHHYHGAYSTKIKSV